jgi:hypothetical protein
VRHEDADWPGPPPPQQQQRADLERERATRSAALAASYEAQARRGTESLRRLNARLAALYRRMEERHLASAQLHGLVAAKLERLAACPEGTLRPVFLAAIASELGVSSALAVLHGRRQGAAVIGASDRTAQAAHDLELVMAEGPMLEAARSGVPVRAAGAALADRWPRYGPAVAELGVQAVVAAPLGLPGTRIGALCALGREPVIGEEAALAAGRMADAFTRLLLCPAGPQWPDDNPFAAPLSDGTGYLAVVHQAAGMVSVHCNCNIRDAQDLLAMRAFAEGVPVADIAVQVVTGQTRFA